MRFRYWSAEKEVDGKLPFLDTLLHCKNDGSLDISVYRKPTHTDRYLNFSSHHPRHVKEGIVSCLFHRARNISQRENIQVEEDHLRGVLEGNGYPEAFVKMASRPHTAREPAEERRATVFIPYVAGLSEDVRRVCRRYNIRTVFRSASTLRGQLTKVKDQDPLEKRSGVVYQIPCSCGNVYIGETKRAFETHIKEHRAATRQGETEKSAIAEHAWGQQHPLLWEETSVLDQAKNNTTLLIKEALHIRLQWRI